MQDKKIWLYSTLSAVIGAVAAMVAIFFIVYSNSVLPKAKNYFDHKFTALDTGIAKKQNDALAALKSDQQEVLTAIKRQNGAVLAAIAKLPLATTSKQIQALNSEIDKTNASLADIQKQVSLSSFKAELAPLVDALNKANAALAALRTGQSSESTAPALARIEKKIDSVGEKIAGIGAPTKTADVTAQLDTLQNSLAAVKQTAGALATDLASVKTSTNGLTTDIASIKKAAATLTAGVASNTASLGGARKSLDTLDQTVKAGFAEDKTSQADLKTAIDKVSQSPPTNPSPKPAKTDLVVFYVSLSGRPPAAPSSIPPLSVKFEKIGSVDAPHQTALIIQKLRPIIRDHKDCSIAVSGYADTLGGDELNHTLSRQRALNIVAALKKAFAGDRVQFTDAAWGERQLKVWTPDATPDAANRRVDIVVHCAGK
jgi:outer membrane protein OmpA-like peptidoglycan-associated protein